ncbi:neutral ceramidase [Caballeronia udeis]|uniref:Neutral ceramidase n=1 Tax=Caballeronia udeis TaxID=1232866 RepID=A0ABW8MXW8_9BURK
MQSRRNFLLAGLGLSAATLTLPGIACAALAKDVPTFRAGAGRADVSFPPSLFPLDGFTGVHDPLAVRVLLLDDGRARVGMVVIDLTSISDGMITSTKAILSGTAGVLPANAIVCAGHSFATPHVFVGGHVPADTDLSRNDAMRQAFEAAIRTAAAQAASSLEPARLGFGEGTSRVSVNRDIPTPYGWWLGANDAGFVDPFLGVMRVDDRNGKPLAVLMNVAVQPSVMDGSQLAAGGKSISADLAGAAARRVESHYPGAVAFFILGAAGDQSPYLQANRHVIGDGGVVGRVGLHEAGFTLLELLGERLAADVVAVAGSIETRSAPTLQVVREHVQLQGVDFSPRNAPVGPVTAFKYRPGAKIEEPVVLVQMGSIAFVGVRPELAATIGSRIRAGSPYPHTIVGTMVDGGAKYLPDAQSYDRFTYEARNSPYAPGTAEELANAVVGKLTQMHGR